MVRRLMLLVAVLSAMSSLGACSETRPSEIIELVVPAGTGDRLAAGEAVTIMPDRLELHVGDSLVIRNEDSVDQSVGPYFVNAGGEVRFTYGKAGRFEGYCPLSEGNRYEIVVEE